MTIWIPIQYLFDAFRREPGAAMSPVATEMTKFCEVCNTPLVKRYAESRGQFAKRRFCSKGCFDKQQRSNQSESYFWASVEVSNPNECWPWMLSRQDKGYGVFSRSGKRWLAHRYALASTGAQIDGRVVMHSCDNPPCCNPAHLSLGTIQDNNADMVKKGRQRAPRGMDQRSARLTPELVRQIRDSPEGARVWAERVNLHRVTIYNVRSGKTWGHVA